MNSSTEPIQSVDDASERLHYDPYLDESGVPLPLPIAVPIGDDSDELIDPTDRIVAPTATMAILRKSFQHRSSPSHVLVKDGVFVDMEEIIIEHSTTEQVENSTTLIDAFQDIRENYRLVVATNSVRDTLARLVITYANYIQTIWGEGRGDPIAFVYYNYFSSETAPDDTLRGIINASPDSFMNEFSNRSLSFQSESENVENLYNDIIESYNTIADAYMPFSEEDIESLTDVEAEELWKRLGLSPSVVGERPSPEQVAQGVIDGLHVLASQPIHTDFKIAGQLSFRTPSSQDAIAGPEIESLVEYSRMIEDPNVDTVSSHVLVSNYPHLGHISKHLSPTSNGMYMYEFMSPSLSMPLIVYTDGHGRRYYKIHEQSSENIKTFARLLMKDTKTYDDLIVERSQYKDASTGRGTAKVAVRREQYEEDYDTIQMIYLQNTDDSRSAVNIILKTTDGSFQSIIDARYETLIDSPFFAFSDLRPVQYTGYFNIYDVEYSEIAFSDIVMNDQSVSELISLSEITNLSVDKLVQSYEYRTPTREQLVKIGFGSLGVPEIRFTISTSLNDDADEAPLGVNKITISYSRVDTQEQLDSFIEFMKLLMLYCANRTPEIIEIYSQYVDVTTNIRTMGNREKLAALHPELFGRASRYTNACAGAVQPTYIDMDDPNDFANKVTNNPIIENEGPVPRPFLTYPRGEKEVTLTCLQNATPYISLKLNREYPDNSEFEHIPCCVRVSTHPGHQLAMTYQETGQVLTTQAPIEELINARILSPGTRSRLEYTNILYILNDYLDLRVEGRVVPVRVGIEKSNQSLLHACNWAMYGRGDVISMDDIFDMIRDEIVFLSVCKQECFDMDIEEIERVLRDPDQIIDSKRFYRLFEEVFQINLYVFEVESNMEFQVPRHRRFHVRANRDRPIVMMIENMVSGVPQYEPIVYHEDIRGSLRLISTSLPEELSDDIYQIYRLSNRTVDDSFEEVAAPVTLTHDLLVNSQIIDQYGRLVGLVYPDKTMFVRPNQPMNLPLANRRLPLINLEETPMIYDAVSIEYVGDTDQVSRQGVWYHEGTEEYFFPVSESNVLEDVDVKPYPDFMSAYDEQLRDFKYSYRTNRMTIQTVLQLFMMLLNRYYPDAEYVPDGLFELTDPDFKYDVSAIPQILPLDIDWELAASICNFVRAPRDGLPGTFLVNSEILSEGMYYYLDRRLRLKLLQGNVIRDRYEFQIPTKRTLKFDSELSYVQWLQSLEYDVKITDSVISGSYPSIYSYIYKRFGRYYMIQPVYSKDGHGAIRATYVSRTWKNEGVNLGYFISVNNMSQTEGVSSSITESRLDNLEADYFVRHDKHFAILPIDSRKYIMTAL